MDHKDTVRHLVDEAINGGRFELFDELFTPESAGRAREWFGSFRGSFPDMHMEIVDLMASNPEPRVRSPEPGGCS